MGGYFICNGIERIIRMLIQQRRHYIMALRRSAYHKRGRDYTDCATLIRSGPHLVVFVVLADCASSILCSRQTNPKAYTFNSVGTACNSYGSFRNRLFLTNMTGVSAGCCIWCRSYRLYYTFLALEP